MNNFENLRKLLEALMYEEPERIKDVLRDIIELSEFYGLNQVPEFKPIYLALKDLFETVNKQETDVLMNDVA